MSDLEFHGLLTRQNNMDGFFSHAISQFPKGIDCAFAYGSGVFQQRNNKPAKDNMIDFSFVVNDPVSWHGSNLAKHPSHYSFIKHLGPKYVANLQCNFGASVYFNTLVEFEGRLIKYGVISMDHLLEDLKDWKTLYISGRLHKPVLKTSEFDSGLLETSFNQNLSHAVKTSLLMLPENFQEIDLYLAITSLSYLGDFRMIFGEDKNKVKNIVIPNLDEFRSLYKNTLLMMPNLNMNSSKCSQDVSPKTKLLTLNSLPCKLKENILKFAKVEKLDFTDLACKHLLEDSRACSSLVSKSVGKIVRYPSITQSLKGILTAGFSKSVFYSLPKVQKMVKSLVK